MGSIRHGSTPATNDADRLRKYLAKFGLDCRALAL